MKVYISGKITDNPRYKEDFKAAEFFLKAAGCQPVNPASESLPEGSSWAEYMKHDIKLLCDCDAIYMLRNWQSSRGAKIEHRLAMGLQLQIMYESEK